MRVSLIVITRVYLSCVISVHVYCKSNRSVKLSSSMPLFPHSLAFSSLILGQVEKLRICRRPFVLSCSPDPFLPVQISKKKKWSSNVRLLLSLLCTLLPFLILPCVINSMFMDSKVSVYNLHMWHSQHIQNLNGLFIIFYCSQSAHVMLAM